MSNKYKILELLKGNGFTVKEIADKTEFNENEVRVYVHRLLKKNLIKEIGKKNRYCIYTVIEKESNDSIRINKLKQVLRVYDKLFRDNIDYVMNNEKMSQFIQDHEDFDLIGEVL